VKHEFLLDENIVILAAKGEDDHHNPDLTATNLVDLIARNCHRITMSVALWRRYWLHLKALEGRKEHSIQQFVAFFVTQLMWNSAKAVFDYAELEDLPEGAGIPRKDVDIVRSALRSKPYPRIVTTDQPLTEAVNASPELGLTIVGPSDALRLAESV
jgi:hypothetical protein